MKRFMAIMGVSALLILGGLIVLTERAAEAPAPKPSSSPLPSLSASECQGLAELYLFSAQEYAKDPGNLELKDQTEKIRKALEMANCK